MTSGHTMAPPPYRVVITGGGTGGHIYPALALVEALKNDPDIGEILYIGNENSLEAEKTTLENIPFAAIQFSGMPRGLPGIKLFKWGLKLLGAIGCALGHLRKFRPHGVVGTGGYVSAPVLIAAKLLGIPYLVHEPDAHPGLVNRLLAPGAAVVTGAFAHANVLLKSKRFHQTGNPLRKAIMASSQLKSTPEGRANALTALELPWSLDDTVLMVTGGSQGAKTLNQAVIQGLPHLIKEYGLKIIHQTGPKQFDEVMKALPEAYKEHPSYCVRPFFESMAPVLTLATLAVTRAGSLSLGELYLMGLPSVLVPYPYAAQDHQRKNAQASVEAGASVMILDQEFTGERLVAVLGELLKSPDRLERMAEASKRLAQADATQVILGLLKGSM